MKFVYHHSGDHWKAELFKKEKGPLLDEDAEKSLRMIAGNVDKRKILGRQIFVHKILEFLTAAKSSNPKRILAINGSKSQCGSDLAKFAVKYAQDRGHFEDGAFYINFENNISESSLLF